MNKFGTLALMGAVVLAAPLVAGDRNWDYTDKYQRDYDRGFFINIEGWWASPQGLPNEWAVQDDVVHEIDFNNDLSGRYSIGAAFGERIGTFKLSYFEFDNSEDDAVTGGAVYSTVFRPELGPNTAGSATEDVKFHIWDLTWSREFARSRKFNGLMSGGLRYWEYKDRIRAMYDGGGMWDGRNDSEAFGMRVGVGGSYWFVPRFALQGMLYASFLSGDTKSSVTTNAGVNRYEKDDKIFTQLEGELYFLWRAVAGLDFTFGYRYATFLDAVDLPGGPGQEEDVRLDGPFVGIGYTFGLTKNDTDGDGVLDYLDDCPGTPNGCKVDKHGCPSDFDEDGVCDGLDRCPGTNFGAHVDSNGCAVDSDSDGVADGLDLCPDTPFGCRVDSKGCPRDDDGDGVCDGLDQCPNTPRGARVNQVGCSEDSDGDTVPDSVDRCPNTPRGVKVNEWGCEVELVFQNIQFDFDKADILPKYEPILDKVVKAMKDNSSMQLRLHGHTDWVYTEDYNLKLSERRANAVKDYLVKHGISADRLEAVGHGECCPIAPNTTPEGRYKNRRVEFERVR